MKKQQDTLSNNKNNPVQGGENPAVQPTPPATNDPGQGSPKNSEDTHIIYNITQGGFYD